VKSGIRNLLVKLNYAKLAKVILAAAKGNILSAPNSTLHSQHSTLGFGVAPVLYLLALIGIASAVLYNNYIQSLRGNITLTQSLGVTSDLDAADKTMASLSVIDASGTGVCPPGLEADVNCTNAVKGLQAIPVQDDRVPNLPPDYRGSIIEFMTENNGEVQVGIFGNDIGIKQLDPWGRYYIVCRWHGKISGTEKEKIAYQIISAGMNGFIETRCGEPAQEDDYSIIRDSAQVTQRSAIWQATGGLIRDEAGEFVRDAEAEGRTLSFAGSGVKVDSQGNLWVPGDLIVKGNTVSYAEENAIRSKTIETETLEVAGGIKAGSIDARDGTFTEDVTIGGTLTGNEGIFQRIRSDRIETDEIRGGRGYFTGDVKVDGNIEGNNITAGDGSFAGEVTANNITSGYIRGTRIEGTDGDFGLLTANEIRANKGYIGRLESTEILTTNITSNTGQITTLTLDNLTVTGNIIGGNVDLTGGSGGISGILPIAYGGTSANTAEGALDNLFSATGTGTALNIERGGTGGTTAAEALNNLFGGDTGAGVSIRSDRLPIIHSNIAAPSVLIGSRYNMFSIDQYGRITGYEYQDIITDRIEVEGGGAVIVDETGITFKIGNTVKGRWTAKGLKIGIP